MTHGRPSYTNGGCRCAACRRAHADAAYAYVGSPRGRGLKRSADARSYLRHRASRLRAVAEYKARNASRVYNLNNNRRVRARGIPGSHSLAEWEALKKAYNQKCGYCGRVRFLTRDHRVPLSRLELNPTNDIANVIPACGSCNSRKQRKTEAEYRPLAHTTIMVN